MVCSAKTLSIDFLQPCVHVFLASQEIGCREAACATRVWVWMSWLLTLQDGKGGFEFVGNGSQVKDKDARKVMRNASSFNSPKFDSLLSVFSFQDIQNIDDLKKVQTSSESLFVSCSGNIFFRRDVTKIEQSKHFCNPCCEFMVCIHVKNCAVTFKLGALTKPI